MNTTPSPEISTDSTYDQLLNASDNRVEYIKTPDAKAFITALEHGGLKLTEETTDELKFEKDKRYGNAYAWLSRQVAVMASGTKPRNFGISQELVEEPEYLDELTDEYTFERPDFSTVEQTGEQGADVLIELLRQVSERDLSQPVESDIPLPGKQERFKLYGCKDVEVYFAQASSGTVGVPQPVVTEVGGKAFWKKNHGGPTLLNLEPITYNGIELPPGCVFRKEDDGGYLFLRITGYAFEQAKAEELFGSAITDYYEMNDGEETLTKGFDAFARARDAQANKD